jgi:hypothetical protein
MDVGSQKYKKSDVVSHREGLHNHVLGFEIDIQKHIDVITKPVVRGNYKCTKYDHDITTSG